MNRLWIRGMAAAAVLFVTAAQPSRGPAVAAGHATALPERLADTGLSGDHVRAFSPQYPLWSDGLTKQRWVYLPPGATIDSADGHEWDFPVGTRFWKEFSLDGRKVETRFLWKASEAGWIPASYVWNAEGTEARLAPEFGVPAAAELGRGRRHDIPSRTDCAACHGTSRLAPLGFNALQLSTDRDPNAIHGEPLAPGMVTLKTLVDEGPLSPARTDLIASPPRIRTESATARAVLGYLNANCGVCHNGKGEIAALGPTFRYQELLDDADAVARRLVGHATRWQLPGAPEGRSVLVRAGAPDSSALLVRMRSRSPSSQMPPLGTVVRDQAAVDAVTKWIATELDDTTERR